MISRSRLSTTNPQLTMKLLILAAVSLALASCAQLAGTTVTLDENGNAIITAPARPIVVPVK